MQPLAALVDRSRPNLPRPRCRVRMVCGPPCAGKSTYVREHAMPGDIVIDFDLIAQEYGYGRFRSPNAVSALLDERNKRLAALAKESPGRVAWFIATAPSHSLRQWWCEMLGVATGDLTVLVPPREELYRRIKADPGRKKVFNYHAGLVAQWFEREHNDNPGIFSSGANVHGMPTDPLHPWNRGQANADKARKERIAK